MKTIEFQTTIEKPTIKIPDFKKLKGHKVKIVLIDLEEESKDFLEYHIKNPLHLSQNGKFLTRDEANER
jgi:hypothetical protein